MPIVLMDGTTGAQSVANALSQNVNAESLFNSMVPFIPWVAVLVGFGFVYNRLIKKPTKTVQSGKVKI